MAEEPTFAHIAGTQSFTRRRRARWCCGTVANRCAFQSKLNPSRAEKCSYNNPEGGTLPASLSVYLLIQFTSQVLPSPCENARFRVGESFSVLTFARFRVGSKG
jgi:hypothetical protein